MKSNFNLMMAQKRGSAHAGKAVDYVIAALIVVLLVGVLGQTIFGYIGTGTGGLGNATENPDVPTWLPTVLIILVGVGFLYMVGRAIGVIKG